MLQHCYDAKLDATNRCWPQFQSRICPCHGVDTPGGYLLRSLLRQLPKPNITGRQDPCSAVHEQKATQPFASRERETGRKSAGGMESQQAFRHRGLGGGARIGDLDGVVQPAWRGR
jgi:hypothetical protein